MPHPIRFLVFVALVLLMGAKPARAALPANGERIETNQYGIDLFQGPAADSGRAMGLGGAYVALAQGVDGLAQNPAAVAARPIWSLTDFDWDLAAGITFPGALSESDFFNTGKGRTELPPTREDDFLFLDLSAAVQLGPFGVGATAALQQYSINRTPDALVSGRDELRARISFFHLDLGYAAFDHQLMLGAGIRGTGLSVVNQRTTTSEFERSLFSTTGFSPEVGFIFRPNNENYRLGASFQGAVATRASSSRQVRVLYEDTDPLYLPEQVILPWILNLGFAFQLGPRPHNPRWYNPAELLDGLETETTRPWELDRASWQAAEGVAKGELLPRISQNPSAANSTNASQAFDQLLRARLRRFPREYLLVSAAIQVTGTSSNAVGIESFLSRTANRSGEAIVISPRLGIETEPWPHRIKLRLGSYLEPTRFRTNPERTRLHGTMGIDANVLSWTLFGTLPSPTYWRVGFVVDVARDYVASSFGLGFWR